MNEMENSISLPNRIALKIGDIYRLNNRRKRQKVINIFSYNGKTYYNVIDTDKDYGIQTLEGNYLCGVTNYYGNVWGGIVELNGKKIRGIGGKPLSKPKDIKNNLSTNKSSTDISTKSPTETSVKTSVNKKPKPLTDFQRFVRVQNSGIINMTDIVTGSRLARITEEKYEDILWNYDDYKKGLKV